MNILFIMLYMNPLHIKSDRFFINMNIEANIQNSNENENIWLININIEDSYWNPLF